MTVNDQKTDTTSKLKITIAKGDEDEVHETDEFKLSKEKYGIKRYQFRFNTSLKLIYFLPRYFKH